MPLDADDRLVGATLGEFVLRQRIGEGGFGVVYRAEQPALDRQAVVKLLHNRLRTTKAATDRFLREAKLASKLDHPYAAHVYAFGAQPDGSLWIAMELVRGTPLDQVLRSQGPISLERFVPLLDRICEVVHTAHEQSIVHRDLKPANVMMLSRAGRLLPKLLDFGIAKGVTGAAEESTSDFAEDATDPGNVDPNAGTVQPVERSQPSNVLPLTQRGAVMGSPPYMAPEQWLDAGKVDARTDLYALGILAYEVLTGRPPFVATTMTGYAQAHANDAPPPLGPRFPAALDAVFAKVLAKRAADRYANALEFATAFREASGIGREPGNLPSLDAAPRDRVINGGPQPIAEAVAAVEAARNAHQSRDAMLQLLRTLMRYLGLLALSCRSRVSGGGEAPGVAELMRALYRRALTDDEWLELCRGLTAVWANRRDAYPVPELIGVFHDPTSHFVEDFVAVGELRKTESITEGALILRLEDAVARLSRLLGELAFLDEYTLVVSVGGGIAERWMGVSRTHRTTTIIRGKNVAEGVPALLDKDGVPVLTLAPVLQVATPTPGAPLELFLFEGRDRRGAKLVSLPSGFEHHDDGVWDWFRAQLAGSLEDVESAAAEERAPYRGLSAFSSDDSSLFFGREKLVDAVANRLRIQTLIAIVGRSGAGKSSFVQAGVIPALPPGWRALTMRPGNSPIATLTARLAGAGLTTDGLRDSLARDRDALGELLRQDVARRGPFLLVIDQFEELFTLCQDAEERLMFAEGVAAAARAPEEQVRVIFTLRDDFLLRTEQFAALRNRIGQGLQLLTVPVVEDLVRILVEPARRVGYEFDPPELPTEMVKEVADQPGALALISFTAAKLWELRDRQFKQLTSVAYKTLGGVGGALAQHAEKTLAEMTQEERRLTREAFRHLVTSQNTRAVLERAELRQLLGGTSHADAVMEKLVAARLLVASENETGAETIEIIHEALLVTWPRLVEWRREHADGARMHEQLRAAAKQWNERGRSKGLLWRGDALAELQRWRSRREGAFTDVETAFANASVSDAARGRRIRRTLLATLVVLLTAGVITLSSLNARIDVQRQRAESSAHRLKESLAAQYEEEGRLALLQGDEVRGMLYFTEAFRSGADSAALQMLTSHAAAAFEAQVALLDARGGAVQRHCAYLTPDGSRAIAAYEDGQVRAWDVRTGSVVYTLRDHRTQQDTGVLRISADGRLAADNLADETVRVWTVDTGAILHVLRHDARVNGIELSPDASRIFTVDAQGKGYLWDLSTGKLVSTIATEAGIWSGGFSHDGRMLAVGTFSGAARLVDAVTGAGLHELEGHLDWVWTTSFANDDSTLLTTSTDKLAKLWDTHTGNLLRTVSLHTSTVESGAFAPSGTTIVTTGLDGSALAWDATTGRLIATIAVRNRVADLAFASEHLLATAGGDGDVAIWDLPSGIKLATLAGHGDDVNSLSFSRDGNTLLSGGSDGSLRVWNVNRASSVVQLSAGHGSVGGVSYDASATHLLAVTEKNAVDEWDIATRQLVRTYRSPHETTFFLVAAISADHRFVAASGSDHTVYVWDAITGALLHEVPQRESTMMISFGADDRLVWGSGNVVTIWNVANARSSAQRLETSSKLTSVRFDARQERVVAASESGAVEIWDIATLRRVGSLQGTTRPIDASFSHDGARIAVARIDGNVEIWSVQSRTLLATLAGHTGSVLSVEFSPDDHFLFTTSTDKTGRLWDATSFRLLMRVDSRTGAFGRAAYSPIGTSVATAGDDGVARIWNLDVKRWSVTTVAAFTRCRLPKRLDEGRIVPHQAPKDCE